MIVHVLVCKARDNLTPDQDAELVNTLHSLREVPGVLEMSAGPNLSQGSKGYTHGAVLRFQSQETLQAYLVDTRHRQLAAQLDHLLADLLVVDYETETSGISA